MLTSGAACDKQQHTRLALVPLLKDTCAWDGNPTGLPATPKWRIMCAVWGAPQSQSPATNTIHVEIDGFRNDKGQVVCSSADGFPKDAQKAMAHTSARRKDKRAVCDFVGVAPNATYAVSVFHDENSNGKLGPAVAAEIRLDC
jgi:hypothetical protein